MKITNLIVFLFAICSNSIAQNEVRLGKELIVVPAKYFSSKTSQINDSTILHINVKPDGKDSTMMYPVYLNNDTTLTIKKYLRKKIVYDENGDPFYSEDNPFQDSLLEANRFLGKTSKKDLIKTLKKKNYVLEKEYQISDCKIQLAIITDEFQVIDINENIIARVSEIIKNLESGDYFAILKIKPLSMAELEHEFWGVIFSRGVFWEIE